MEAQLLSAQRAATAMTNVTEKIIGADAARSVTFALMALTVYEYFITLDEERELFWTGPFSVSHALFFFNRYFPPIVVMCKGAVQITFLLSIIGIGAIKAILLIRVWFLFPGNKAVRSFLVLAFLTSLVTTFILLYDSVNRVQILTPLKGDTSRIIGCRTKRPPQFWRIYLPTLILHTCLYVMTVYQALSDAETRKRKELCKCLLRDGGMFYFIVMCSVGFTSIGSFLVGSPRINIPAIFSPIVLSTTSLATTRIMFSLRATTNNVGNDFEVMSLQVPQSHAGMNKRRDSTDSIWGTNTIFQADEEKGSTG
ncbi:hypothetical protein CVT24_007482 [Panaeolus cyanescens]|uniref:DUF6533 domain-containing protein n=1 Tax=Panaeolus cyanescens TaxID=181874 RepID=A0A409YL97_9AGAR|nr:hypothetical protein CVT24_007482 [Panaeolus cyanescens]